jgi:SAM-dependent methyltransferase
MNAPPPTVTGCPPMSAPDVVAAASGEAVRVVIDPEWGYRRIDPLPTVEELDRFYESRYRDLIDGGGRAPELSRLVRTGPDAERERAWLAATVHADVVDALAPVAGLGTIPRSLDVGCGTGDLVRVLAGAGWAATGIEPATEIAAVGRAAGLQIEPDTAAEFLERWRRDGSVPFAAITLMNVLEHVPAPGPLLHSLLEALAPGGRVIVRVPNDFNPLQALAREALGHGQWWVVVPDHLNYFDHASAAGLLERLGLEIVDQWADFPMELFMLMGDDYVADPSAGPIAHERRRRMELTVDADTRRRIGRAWVTAGFGRNTFVVARLPVT